MKKPLISVVIPAFNYGRFIGKAIESVLSQTYRDVELIIVDDGSTDETREVVSQYSGRLNFISQINAGQSQARNQGVSKSRGSLIAFLDADDFWEPDKLEKQQELLIGKYGLIYSGARTFNSSTGEVISILEPKFRGDCSKEFISKPGIQIVTAGESSVLVRKELMESIGGFDRELSIGAGYDFYRRCSNIADFNFVNEILVNCRSHGSNISLNKELYISDFRLTINKTIKDADFTTSLIQKFKLKVISEYLIAKTQIKEYLK